MSVHRSGHRQTGCDLKRSSGRRRDSGSRQARYLIVPRLIVQWPWGRTLAVVRPPATAQLNREVRNVKLAKFGIGTSGKFGVALVALTFAAQPLVAQTAPASGPIDLTKQAKPPVVAPTVAAPVVTAAPSAPVAAPHWTQADAQALLAAIKGIGAEGLFPKDYQPEALSAAIVKGEGPELDETAT